MSGKLIGLVDLANELGATVAFVRVAKECGIAPHTAMTFVARLRRMPKKERMTLAKKLSTEVDS